MTVSYRQRRLLPLLPALLLACLPACDQRMEEQPRLEALEPAPMLDGGRAALHPPPGTVALESGTVTLENGTVTLGESGTVTLESAAESGLRPPEMDRGDLERGKERYEIYCVPCHSLLGDGNGPVVLRGFPAPPSFHIPRLRNVPLAHFYAVIRDGHGIMYSYADRVPAADRWRIAFYIRALQQSQHTDPRRHPEMRAALETAGAGPGEELP